MKHSKIRAAILDALKSITPDIVRCCDGRPAFIDPEDLPAMAIYISDAQATEDSIDEDMWHATLHIEVFLKADEPDSALDEWMEKKVLHNLKDITDLGGLVETMSAQGYDYQRDDEMATWGSADMKYSLSYTM